MANVNKFKIIPFILFILSTQLLFLLLYIFTLYKYLPKETTNFFGHFLILCYVVFSVTYKEIRFSSLSIRGQMSIFNWLKYVSFPILIKVYFTAVITTAIGLFVLSFPSIYELLIDWLLTQDMKTESRSIVSLVLIFISSCIFAPIWEELFYRGILLRKIMHRYSVIPAIFFSSLIFAIVHSGMLGIVNAFLLGCFFAYVYLLKQNIWIPIILHSIANFISLILSIFSSPVDTTVIKELPSFNQLKIELVQELIISGLISLALTIVITIIIVKGFKRVQSL